MIELKDDILDVLRNRSECTYVIKNILRSKHKGITTPKVKRVLDRLEVEGEVVRVVNPYSMVHIQWDVPPLKS